MEVVKPFKVSPSLITVVGCGGIGARLVPTLVKMVSPLLEAQGLGHLRAGDDEPQKVEILLIDPDEVVERNTWRQPFIMRDVGKAKSAVLAGRYSTEFVSLTPYQATIEECLADIEIRSKILSSQFLLTAADGKAPRIALQQFRQNLNGLWVDAGNDGDRGQITLQGCVVAHGTGAHAGVYDEYFSLRGDMAFADLFVPDPEPTPEEKEKLALEACGVRVDTQTPVTNTMAASLMLNYVWGMMEGKPLASLGCRFSLGAGTDFIRMRRALDNGEELIPDLPVNLPVGA